MSEEKEGGGFASRLLHGVKDLVWEDDPTPQGTVQAPVAGSRPAAPVTPVASPGASRVQPLPLVNPVIPAPSGMAAELMAVVMNRPTPYSSLTEAITALSEIPMDEATRYRSAFAVLKKTQQRTVEQITQAVDVHIAALESEKVRFSSQSQSVEDSEITARAKEVAALNLAITQANEQIDKLRADTEARIRQIQDDIGSKQRNAEEMSRKLEEKKRSILQTTQNFEAAVDVVRAALNADKAKVQQYLS
jgi:hypothetical protein